MEREREGERGEEWNGGTAQCTIPSSILRASKEYALFYMIVEHYRGNDPRPVYKRFREQGRLAPQGVEYVGSWVDTGLGRCFQVMQSPNEALLKEWMSRWQDLVDFEFWPVLTSAEAAEKVARMGEL